MGIVRIIGWFGFQVQIYRVLIRFRGGVGKEKVQDWVLGIRQGGYFVCIFASFIFGFVNGVLSVEFIGDRVQFRFWYCFFFCEYEVGSILVGGLSRELGQFVFWFRVLGFRCFLRYLVILGLSIEYRFREGQVVRYIVVSVRGQNRGFVFVQCFIRRLGREGGGLFIWRFEMFIFFRILNFWFMSRSLGIQ